METTSESFGADPAAGASNGYAAAAERGDAPLLPSGATHDASAMADLCDISMLFVRCKDGLSHRPEEFASAEDMGAAIDVTCAYLRRLAKG